MPLPPTLHLVAGVNGAGKTTFYYRVLKEWTPGAEFVNADEIARARWPGSEEAHAAEVAGLAERRRDELLEAGLSFVAETVFSHPSKLDLIEKAKSRGFRVILYHVGVSSEELARARVDTRVEMGGHSVPPERIADRYERTQRLIPRAAEIAERCLVFDNSGNAGTTTLTHVMTIVDGRIMTLAEDVPAWVEDAYGDLLTAYRRDRR